MRGRGSFLTWQGGVSCAWQFRLTNNREGDWALRCVLLRISLASNFHLRLYLVLLGGQGSTLIRQVSLVCVCVCFCVCVCACVTECFWRPALHVPGKQVNGKLVISILKMQ